MIKTHIPVKHSMMDFLSEWLVIVSWVYLELFSNTWNTFIFTNSKTLASLLLYKVVLYKLTWFYSKYKKYMETRETTEHHLSLT